MRAPAVPAWVWAAAAVCLVLLGVGVALEVAFLVINAICALIVVAVIAAACT